MRIPLPDNNRVAVRPVATPYSNKDTRSGLEALSEGMGQLAQAARRHDGSGLNDRAKREADEFRADEADLAFGRKFNQHFYEKDTGFLNQLGEKGLDTAPVFESLEKARKDISDGLANEEQRRKFHIRSGVRLEQGRALAEKHSSAQRLHLYKNVAEGAAQLALDTAAANPADVNSAVGKVLVDEDGNPGPLRRYLLKQGLPAEAVQAEESKFMAQAYGRAVQSYLDVKDWQAADGLLSKVEGQLGPGGKRLRATVNRLKEDVQGEATAMKLVEDARDPWQDGRVDPAKAFDALDKLPEGPLRDKTRQRLEHRLSIEARDWREKVDARFHSALNSYLMGGERLTAIDSEDSVWLEDYALEEWNKLLEKAATDERRRAYDARQLAALGQRESRRETEGERQALVALEDEMAREPDKFREMPIQQFTADYGSQLSPEGYKQAGRKLADLKKEPKGTSAEFDGYVRDEVKGDKALQGNKKAEDRFKSYMGKLRRHFVREHKREPNLEEMKAMRAEADRKGVEERWILPDREVPAYMMDEPPEPKAIPAKPATPKTAAPPAAAKTPGAKTAPKKVEVTNGTERGLVPEDKVEAWLADPKRKGWRRK